MTEILNKLLMLQSDIKPKLLQTLEDFSKRFGADFLLLVFPQKDPSYAGAEPIFMGREPRGARDIKTLTDYARNEIGPANPVLLQKDAETAGTDTYLSYVFIPVELAGDPRCVIVLGFAEAVTLIPDTYQPLAYELLYMHNNLLFRQSVMNQKKRDTFLLAFGKALGNVRDCKQLFYLMESTLKPFIKYLDCAIFELDAENGSMINICLNAESALLQYRFRESLKVTAVPFYGIIENNYTTDLKIEAFDFTKLTGSTEITPFLVPGSVSDANCGQIFNLYNGREIVGNCIFIFAENYQMDEELKCLMPLIMNQLSNAVTNNKSIREIEQKNQERDILQSINTNIAFYKDKLTLLKSINPKLKLLINYSHHFVKTINDDQKTVTGLLGDLDSRARFHPDYGHMVSAKFPISEQVFKLLLSNDPMVFDLDEQVAMGRPLPLYMQINYECGIRKMAMLSLRVGSKIIGIWVICLLEGQEINAYQLELLKGISRQLSIAAENIKAADIVARKNKEREFLSQISSDITAIRERKDLDKLFNRTLKEEFRFQEAVVMIKNDDYTYNKFLYTPEMYGADPGHDVDYSGLRHQVNDAVYIRLMKCSGATVYDLDSLLEGELIPDYIKSEYAAGIRRKIGIKLVRDKADIGAVFFNYTAAFNIEDQEPGVYNAISYPLSTAISNVLLNEEVIRRENERELLFALSTEIATVRNSSQLIRVITEKLREYLGFSYVAIGTVDESGSIFNVLQFDPESICRTHPDYKDLISAVFPVNDGVINKVLMSPVALSLNLDEVASKQDLTTYLRISRESGIKQVVGMRFSRDQAPFGLLMFFFEKELQLSRGKSSLISGLGNQISIAVANIKANQELQQRADEESKLQVFGAALRTVKDIGSLSKILRVQLKGLFQMGDFVICMIDNEQRVHPLLVSHLDPSCAMDSSSSISEQDFAQVIFDDILSSNELVFFDSQTLADLSRQPELPKTTAVNRQGVVGAILKLGQQPVGFMLFQHENLSVIASQRKLFESITSQIAIVASNILSHQKIETQLKEIEAYRSQLEEEKIYLTEEIDTIHNYTEIIGGSTALKDVFKLVSQVSPSDSSVLILGETGTGKELIARAIHNNSPRKNKLMVKVNCAALPANLIESELFGHERGSFTGATERRLGKFELANHGTLFLDEIGEMPVDLQVKLLRALQEREIERVGGKETIKIDVRIIAATNRDLEKEIAEGRFRSDLYYRLNIFPIALPPLRDRKQDIEQLSMHFIKQFNKNCGKNINSISSRALEELKAYDWPGNIRELEHLIERSVLLTTGTVLKQLMLPAPEEQLVLKAQLEELSLKTIDENEKDYILKILKHCGGRIAGNGGAAQILGVPPTTLNSKIKRLGIKREHTL